MFDRAVIPVVISPTEQASRPPINKCKYMHEDCDQIVASDANADADDPEQGHQEPQERILSSKHEVVDIKVDRFLRRPGQEAEPAACQRSLGRLRKRHGEESQCYEDERQRRAKANVHAFGKGHEDACQRS